MSSVYAYLLAQSADDINKLYGSEWCTLAVFQSLDDLSKQMLVRLLFCKGTVIAREFLEQWVKPAPHVQAELLRCIERMLQLYILGVPPALSAQVATGASSSSDQREKPPLRRGLDMNGMAETEHPLVVNGFFLSSLQRALTTSESTPWAQATASLPPLGRPPTPATIENHAAQRWNAILHFLIGTEDAPLPDNKVIELLVSTHLLAPGGSSDDELYFDAEGNPMGVGSIHAEDGGVNAATAAARSGLSLTYSQIMELGGGAVHITRQGYEFLLKDTAVQLWTFVDEYLRTAPARGMTTSDILAFLFEIGFCRMGEGYAVSALSATQLQLLEDFQSFGLVFVPEDQEVVPELDLAPTPRARGRGGGASEVVHIDMDEGEEGAGDVRMDGPAPQRQGYDYSADPRRFFPTSLAIILTQPDLHQHHALSQQQQHQLLGDAASAAHNLASAASNPFASSSSVAPALGGPTGKAATMAEALVAESQRYGGSGALSGGATDLRLVVEKNFKVYAYTSVDLHLALIALFAKVEQRLPNMVVATLTRKSVITAMDKGISAAQIRRFLSSRVHRTVTAQGLEVPENVVDQLFLWERERLRVAFRPGVLLSAFDTPAQFSAVLEHMLAVNGVDFADETTGFMVVPERHLDTVKEAVRALRAAGVGAGNRG